MTLGGICLGMVAIFLPPLAVVTRRGCGSDLLINIALCILGWIPGVLHAWYVILEYPSARQRRHMRKARRPSVVREEIYIPPTAHSHRARSRSVGRHTAPAARTRSRSVGRRSADVYAEGRRPHYQGYAYDDRMAYAPAPRSNY